MSSFYLNIYTYINIDIHTCLDEVVEIVGMASSKPWGALSNNGILGCAPRLDQSLLILWHLLGASTRTAIQYIYIYYKRFDRLTSYSPAEIRLIYSVYLWWLVGAAWRGVPPVIHYWSWCFLKAPSPCCFVFLEFSRRTSVMFAGTERQVIRLRS